MPSIGPLELAVVAIIALMVFGPKRLPELGKSLGSGLRSFKGSLGADDDEQHAGLPEARPEKALDARAPQVAPQRPAVAQQAPVGHPHEAHPAAAHAEDPLAARAGAVDPAR